MANEDAALQTENGLNRAVDWAIGELRGKTMDVPEFVHEQWGLLSSMMGEADKDRLAQVGFLQRVTPFLRNPLLRENIPVGQDSPEAPRTMLAVSLQKNESQVEPTKNIVIEFKVLELTTLQAPNGERKPLILFHRSEISWLRNRLQRVARGIGEVDKAFGYIETRMKQLGKNRISELAHGEKSKIERILHGLKTKGFLAENWLE